MKFPLSDGQGLCSSEARRQQGYTFSLSDQVFLGPNCTIGNRHRGPKRSSQFISERRKNGQIIRSDEDDREVATSEVAGLAQGAGFSGKCTEY